MSVAATLEYHLLKSCRRDVCELNGHNRGLWLTVSYRNKCINYKDIAPDITSGYRYNLRLWGLPGALPATAKDRFLLTASRKRFNIAR